MIPSHSGPLRGGIVSPYILLLLLTAGAVVPEVRIADADLFAKSLRAAAQTVEQYGIHDDPEESERVNRIGYALALESGFDKYPFTFQIIDMPIPNAFALPAGQIFITRGMLDLGLTDQMLAGLLGHEIAHVTQEHFLELRRRATKLNVLTQLLAVGAMVAASQSSSDRYGPYGLYSDNRDANLAQGAMVASMVVNELLLRGYSRENEDEADEEGQRYAAAAGFDPRGTQELMSRMFQRMPQAKDYGYLRTHPFLDDRARAAAARKVTFKVLEPGPEELQETETLRRQTQSVLLGFLDERSLEPPLVELVKTIALTAWPQGEASDGLRLERLHKRRDEVLEQLALSRDYGRLIAQYQEELETVESFTPDSPLLATLRQEVGDMRSQLEKLYPEAVKVFYGGVFERPFLEAFKSNYPHAPEVPRVALELGKAYSRLGLEAEAVSHFLETWRDNPESEAGQEAQRGLRNLAPILRQLGALELLATQEQDESLRQIAEERLDQLASRYEDIKNGADYLARFPDGLYALTVRHRLDQLADKLYREMLLFQKVGDSAKAVERAKTIVTYAPLSPAADKLSDESIVGDSA